MFETRMQYRLNARKFDATRDNMAVQDAEIRC